MKIYINSKIIGDDNYQRIKKQFFNVNITDDLHQSYDAEVIMSFANRFNNEFLMNFSNLKWIQLYSAGFNLLGSDAFSNPNITITNARDVHSIPIAEDVILKILMINRNLKYYLNNMKEGLWNPRTDEIELTNSTVGIIGVGSIGKEIAKRLKPFNVKIIGYRLRDMQEENFDKIYVGNDGLKEVLSKSDYLILALPLNSESVNLINKDTIQLMKKNTLLINISRGEIINEEDLISALENKLIRGAALDVTVTEPLPKDSPLWKLENVFITPHNSANSQFSKDRIAELLIENLNYYLNNKKLRNVVN